MTHSYRYHYLEGMEESQFYKKKPLITLSEPYQTAPKKSNVLNLKVQREM